MTHPGQEALLSCCCFFFWIEQVPPSQFDHRNVVEWLRSFTTASLRRAHTSGGMLSSEVLDDVASVY